MPVQPEHKHSQARRASAWAPPTYLRQADIHRLTRQRVDYDRTAFGVARNEHPELGRRLEELLTAVGAGDA